jgi:hypothetical protein
MRGNRLRRFCLVALMPPAMALGMPHDAAAQDAPRVTIAIGPSLLQDETARAPGGAVDLAWRMVRAGRATIGIAGEFGFNYFEGAAVSSYLAGPRLTLPALPIGRPFAQVLVGAEHCCGENAIAIQLGGGVDLPLHRAIGLRVAYDYRRASYDQALFHERRLWVGVSIPFGLTR